MVIKHELGATWIQVEGTRYNLANATKIVRQPDGSLFIYFVTSELVIVPAEHAAKMPALFAPVIARDIG